MTAAAVRSACGPGAEPLALARLLEGRLRVRPGNGALIRHPSPLRQICAASLLISSWCVARIDLALEELRSRSNGDPADLAPQALAGAGSLEADLLLRGGHQALTLLRRRPLACSMMSLARCCACSMICAAALARLAQDRFGACARLLQLVLAPVGRGEPLSDLALALLDRAS